MRFPRRTLLKGLGAGAALFGPFLRHRSSMAQTATPAGNFLVFYTPNGHKRALTTNGVTTPAFDATGSSSSLTLGSAMQPLVPFTSDIAVIRGLNSKTPTFIASHQDNCRILTCWGAPKEGNDNSQFTGYGPSIDQAIGMAFGERPLVVAVDPFRDMPHWRNFLNWRSSGVNEPFTKDFMAVYTDLFGMLTNQPTTADQTAAIMRAKARNQSILDFVKSDIATFRSRINSADKAHMDAYLDSIQSLETKVTSMATVPGTCSTTTLQPAVATMAATKAPIQNDDKSPNMVVGQLQARGRLWMDMISTAFACGTRRVATIQWQGASEGYDPAGDLGSPTHHSVSHGSAPAQHWADIDTWYSTEFAYLLNSLKTFNVLDKTVIAWVSEITEGHNQIDMVTVVAGGQALGLKMGQYIKYPITGGAPEGSGAIPVMQNPANKGLNDFWITLQNAVGVSATTFGDPKYCTGPLAELKA
ncbi:MAG TPA: DUF1552 domain-containing protein [Polyangia bacterium]|nr:DUF1552 domain-containing protein [Polyangia bacterium]